MAYNQDTLPKRTRRLIKIDPVSGCWLWQGRLDKDGYGPHRAIYIKLTGHVPVGLVLDHREDFGCTSRACCNPAHLVPVTNRINTLRGQSFAAVNAAKEKCDNGHRFDFSNTYIRPNGHRDCRACIRQRVRKYQRRVRAGRRHLREQSAELARAA